MSDEEVEEVVEEVDAEVGDGLLMLRSRW